MQWVLAHELGHALGLQHNYRPSGQVYNAAEDPEEMTLMHPFYGAPYASNELEKYDYDEFEYIYPN